MYRWVVYVIIHLKLFKYVKSLPKIWIFGIFFISLHR